MLAVSLPAQTASETKPAASDDEIIVMSPFTVSTERDTGYRASNSIAGTRTNTAIKDIPMNIQVFTRELADDLLIKNQVDFEAYNASLVNGNADRFSDNFIQQQYQAFLFRGFRQNWGLRDGIREYDPVDTQNLARVEVVKGPAAALYGLSYPGGVMQNITKTVDYTKNFGQARITVGAEGDYRFSLDANVTGDTGLGKFGIRYNGAYEKTKDQRAHSEGKVDLNAVIVDWQPTKSTQLELLLEEGYRAKPNNLGIFTAGEVGATGNGASIPLNQILRPDIPWDWNWSNGKNLRSLETSLYRAKLTQKFGEQLQVQAYYQYSTRLNIDGNGWGANGSDGVAGADSWEMQGSGWDQANNRIINTYHYRDWGNKMHAYGVTGVYNVDIGKTKHTFAFGGAAWLEAELSRASGPYDPNNGGFSAAAALQSAVYYPVQANIPLPVPTYPPANLAPEVNGGPNGNGYHHENNSNDYYFANWQMSALDGRLRTNIGVNKTNIRLITYNTGASVVADNDYEDSKVSPLYGAVFAVTKSVSLFAVHSTSLFPDSTKNSYGDQFDPIVGSSMEGGVKFETEDGKWSGTVSMYKIKQTGGTQNSPTANNLTTDRWDSLTPAQRQADPQFTGRVREDFDGDIVAGGEQVSKGYEVDLVYQPNKSWQMVLSYAYTDHEFTSSLDPGVVVGQTYQFATKHRYSMLTKYSFTEGKAKGLSVGMGLSGGSKVLQDYSGPNGSARYEPGRLVGEIFGIYRIKPFGRNAFIQLNIRNLFETPDYIGWKATGSSTIIATERYKVPTDRIYRLTLGFDF